MTVESVRLQLLTCVSRLQLCSLLFLTLGFCPAADGAHTLTCALMLLNTDLHGHVCTQVLYRTASGGFLLSFILHFYF